MRCSLPAGRCSRTAACHVDRPVDAILTLPKSGAPFCVRWEIGMDAHMERNPADLLPLTGDEQPTAGVPATREAGKTEAPAQTVIPVGPGPFGVAVTSGGKAYVAVQFQNSTAVIDTTTDTVLRTVPVGTNPSGVAIAPNRKAYITNSRSASVSVIDTTTDTVVRTVPVGTNPQGVAVACNGKAYVANYDLGTVSVIDTATDAVLGSIAVGTNPEGVAVACNGKAYVANYGAGTVSVIDTSTDTVVRTVPVGTNPEGVAVACNGKAYVANRGADTVSVIDTATDAVLGSIAVGRAPFSVAIAPDLKAYVANRDSNTVSVIDTVTDTVLGSVPAGYTPTWVAVAPNGKIYVTNSGANTVTVLTPFPGIRSFSPASGTALGGTTVTIRGSGFTGATAVSIAGVPAASFTVADDTAITAVTGASQPHTGPVTITTPGGTTTSTASYTYTIEPTTTTLTFSPAAPRCGEKVALTATVASATGSVTSGVVTFLVSGDGPPQTVPVGASGQASVESAGLDAGAHQAIAVYTSNNPGLSGSASDLVGFTVSRASTTTAVTATPNPSTVGQTVTLSATVTPVPPGTGVPTGRVVFTTPGGLEVTAPVQNGQAVVTVGSLPLGTTTVTATYSGDSCFEGSSGTVDTTVNASTATRITATPAVIRLNLSTGQFYIPTLSATLTDRTTDLPIPGQTIAFTATTVLGPLTLGTAVTDARGTATLTDTIVPPTLITAGHYTAAFAGSPGHPPATATASLTYSPI
ncbi:Ig-like domain repeat protein [Streptomyces sparsogenes]